VPSRLPLREFLAVVAAGGQPFYVVDGAEGRPVGLVSLRELRAILTEDAFLGALVVADAMAPWRSLSESANLREALRTFIESGHAALPVTTADTAAEVVGTLSHEDLITAYHQEMIRRRRDRRPQTQELPMVDARHE
jgi:CIC family chloride channel protein